MVKKQQAVITCREQAAELCLFHDPTLSSQQPDYFYCPQSGGLSQLNPEDYTFGMVCDQHNEENQTSVNRYFYIIISMSGMVYYCSKFVAKGDLPYDSGSL
jgi:hypothetical protein